VLAAVPEPDAPAPAPGTCVPATGGSTTVGFFGQPASSAAPASRKTIDSMRFIDPPNHYDRF
jgi:hypothetical protein